MAAVLGAAGAALGTMVCRFTTGEKYKEHAAAMENATGQLVLLQEKLLPLADADAGAYDRVSAALAMPKSTDVEKAARKQAMNVALLGAMAVPVQTMELSRDTLSVLSTLAASTNKNLSSDLASGALCLGAAVESAWFNVLVNAGSLKDDSKALELKQRAEKIRQESGALVAAILNATTGSNV